MHSDYSKTTYTLAEAAALLSCHKETLRRAIHSGNLQAAKLGREFRLSRVDLEAFWMANGGGVLFPEDIENKEQTPEKQSQKEKEVSKVEDNGPEQLCFF